MPRHPEPLIEPGEALKLVDGYCARLEEQVRGGAGPEVSAQYGDAMVRRAAIRELVAE